MDDQKKALIHRNLVFWLDAGPVDDPEKLLRRIALDCDCTTEEVWSVYSEMVAAALYSI